MPKSQNGWPASPTLATRAIVVGGATFRVADNRDVETVFTYIVTRYEATVEPLNPARCAGFNYRPNANDPSELSNHSSATALDINWEQHPNATPTLSTLTRAQVAACHAILTSIPELDEVVHWGGDWASPLTTDAMHWELHDHDLAKLARVAERLRSETVTPEDIDKTATLAAQKILASKVPGGAANLTVLDVLERLGKAFDKDGQPK